MPFPNESEEDAIDVTDEGVFKIDCPIPLAREGLLSKDEPRAPPEFN